MEHFILDKFAGLDAGVEPSDADTKAQYLLARYREGKFQPHMEADGGIKGSYLVVLNEECSKQLVSTGLRFEKLNMEKVEMSTVDEAVELLSDNEKCIKRVEQDATTSMYQYSLPPWGLDVIDGVTDGSYTRALSGTGVDVFVLDTGIDATHTQFTGNVGTGRSFAGGSTADSQGHGTHCAGTIAGSDVGVAPGATVIPVKVLSDSGSGSWSWFINALNYLIGEKESRGSGGRPMVASASLGGGYYQTANDAVNAAVDAGITVVVASGNSARDASRYSPASAEKAITVSALTQSEGAASFSNYGSSVNIWAPGVNVLSARANTGSGLIQYSGTSMACPHVAGVVALLLETNPSWTPAQVQEHLYSKCSTSEGFSDLKLRTFAALPSSQCAASGSSVTSVLV